MRTAHWPTPLRAPIQPRVLVERGLCAKHPHGEWWTSSLPLERSAAATVCGYCPVLETCRTWAVTLPLNDNGVYGATDAKERQQLRKAAQETVSATAADQEITPAA